MQKKKKEKENNRYNCFIYIYIYVLVGLAEKFSSLPCILTCYCLVIYLLPSEIFTSSRNESAIIICCSKKKKKKSTKDIAELSIPSVVSLTSLIN